MCSGSEAGSYLRLIDSCITQVVVLASTALLEVDMAALALSNDPTVAFTVTVQKLSLTLSLTHTLSLSLSFLLSLSLSLAVSLSHTHSHTHAHALSLQVQKQERFEEATVVLQLEDGPVAQVHKLWVGKSVKNSDVSFALRQRV